jgi:uncharacterized protein (DUF427 family)
MLEGNAYFPPEAVNREHLIDSPSRTVCPWKGVAHYYTVVAGEGINPGCGLVLPRPSPLARKIKGHVAFWHGVRVETSIPTAARRCRVPGCWRGCWAAPGDHRACTMRAHIG